jgi:hypothetical protein
MDQAFLFYSLFLKQFTLIFEQDKGSINRAVCENQKNMRSL